jgi:hypothetical protein
MTQVLKGKYRHFKGNMYEVIGTARHSETEEEFVLYRPLYKLNDPDAPPYTVRPIKSFFGQVSPGKPRFEYVDS